MGKEPRSKQVVRSESSVCTSHLPIFVATGRFGIKKITKDLQSQGESTFLG